jgi:hypothetical protein
VLKKGLHRFLGCRFRLTSIAHRGVLLALTALAGVALLAWALVLIPRHQVDGVTVEAPDRPAKTAALINEYRRTLIQAVGGVFIVVGALSGAYFTWRQITVNREGQTTDRFTKRLGSSVITTPSAVGRHLLARTDRARFAHGSVDHRRNARRVYCTGMR